MNVSESYFIHFVIYVKCDNIYVMINARCKISKQLISAIMAAIFNYDSFTRKLGETWYVLRLL